MSDQVTLSIDGVEVTVPKGTLVVDAAKRIGNDIPVFCYHPKMDPVGMCRMCLVRIGIPMFERGTGEPVLDEDGKQKYMFRGLQTGCTVQVSEGMVVESNTEVVEKARGDVIEFLLTSHPLDCPICDKGGECPLQNLTMRHGEGTSRFDFSDKLKGDKHVPLGDLIFLDRERCIQCARCTRFQAEVVDDPVIAFHNRGRRLEITTLSDPGFDSYWSGNTTDICPVGALTTSDFRFGARPWELKPSASICPHCPVGCNLTFSTRREAKAGGKQVIKRVMPRQNEAVNEIWICDKGRFAYHFVEDGERLQTPLIRKNGELVEASWDEALALVAEKLKAHKATAAGIAGDRLSNEDLYQFQALFREQLGNGNIDLAQRRLAGGDVVAQVGIAKGSNLLDLGAGDAILVVASDLHEEAPVWWLRVKQAAERGVTLVVVNPRETRLDAYAAHTLLYHPRKPLETVKQLVDTAKVELDGELDGLQAAAQALAEANNLVAFYGYEGLSYEETDSLARLLGNLLLMKKGDAVRAGQKNNGLVPVWPRNNTQGAWDVGLHPAYGPGYKKLAKAGLAAEGIYAGVAGGTVKALYVAGSDPIGDGLLAGRGNLEFLVVQELFLTATAQAADVVLPAQSWAEREGTYTSGERRVQRFYPSIAAVGQSRADWQILAQVTEQLGGEKVPFAASILFTQLAKKVAPYKGMDYRGLAKVEKQWPDVGGDDLYYGGNAYNNGSGLGVQWAAEAESKSLEAYKVSDVEANKGKGIQLVSAPALYRTGSLVDRSSVLAPRMAQPEISFHANDAQLLAVEDGDRISLRVNGQVLTATAHVNGQAQAGVAFLRGTAYQPTAVPQRIEKVSEKEA
ncbi:MAG TPA: NADH-quinone oxidoreductase subunit NuoG [Anaerolineae bacterium]|nr:NADH-quinone oxidoreductase subunit NuoG [Anaerolineae bacterium]